MVLANQLLENLNFQELLLVNRMMAIKKGGELLVAVKLFPQDVPLSSTRSFHAVP